MNRAGFLMMGVNDENAVIGLPYLSAVCVYDQKIASELLIKAYTGQTSHFEFKVNGAVFLTCCLHLLIFLTCKISINKFQTLPLN
jgi:hypothetical protein